MKNSEVVNLYNALGKEPESNENILYDIESIARKNREEFYYLVELFNKEKNFSSMKWRLSTILRNLNYEPVKDYYLDVIANHPDLSERAEASVDLIRMNDQRGADAFYRLVFQISCRNQSNLIYDLVDIDSIMSLKSFLKLFEREPELGHCFEQKEEVERRLEDLLQNNKS